VSFYFCFDDADGDPMAVVAEVDSILFDHQGVSCVALHGHGGGLPLVPDHTRRNADG
jgi:hypothetical protein